MSAPPPVLRAEALTVGYGGEPPVVCEVTFDLAPGEVLALLGPSGSGKTTTLRALAGFEPPRAGRILGGGRILWGPGVQVPPHRRGLGYVFQDYALFPHLSVAANVAFGLQALSKPERQARVAALLDLVDLRGFADRKPHALSGGQQQRVALARGAAPAPAALLMDEPFGNLDADLRPLLRQRILTWLAERGTSVAMVTHDRQEALAVAHRVAVMRAGRLVQVGRPEHLYHRPRTAFVARFMGEANLIEGQASGLRAETPLGAVALPEPAEGPVWICLRPHALTPAADGAEALVLERRFAGDHVRLVLRVGERRLVMHRPPDDRTRPGVHLRLRAQVGVAVTLDAPLEDLASGQS